MDNLSSAWTLSEVKRTRLGRFEVVQTNILKNGRSYPYSYLREAPCICILPVFHGNVVYIRQYRYAVSDWCLELPCGTLEAAEDPEHAARRELSEETGLHVKVLSSLGSGYARAGISDCHVFFYLAECDMKKEQEPDPTEQIQLLHTSLSGFDAMIDSRVFSQVLGVICWQRAKHLLFSEHSRKESIENVGRPI